MSRPAGYTTLVQHRAAIAPLGRSVGELLSELDHAISRRIAPNTWIKVVLVISVVASLTKHLGVAASDILTFFAGVSVLRLMMRKSLLADRRIVEVARALEDAGDLRVVPALAEVYRRTGSPAVARSLAAAIKHSAARGLEPAELRCIAQLEGIAFWRPEPELRQALLLVSKREALRSADHSMLD